VAYSNLGGVLLIQGKFDDAAAELRKAVELDPKFALAHTRLGVALLAQGKLDAAETESRTAVALDPKFALAHDARGAILYVYKRHDEGLTELRRAAELDPHNSVIHAHLGAVLRDLGYREDAIAEYRKAIALDQSSALVHAFLRVLLPDGAESAAELHRAIQVDPGLARDLSNTAGDTIDRATKIASPDFVKANLIDACWMLVAASRLSPSSDYSAELRRINDKLAGVQHCPPDQVSLRQP
jgi:tetratricopeptide (TPR) repeat protein